MERDADTPSTGLERTPDSRGRPVAVDVRVLVKPHGIAIVEMVPWAGRPLPARRRFQVVDPEIRPADGSGRSAVLGQFETGDAYEEQRPGLDRVALQRAGQSNPPTGIACQCGIGLFSFDLDPASPVPRAFAVWLYSESPASPPSALVLSRVTRAPLSESLIIERSTGIPDGQGLALPPGERWLVLRERKMNGAYGPAFRFRLSIPRTPNNGACEGA